MSYAPNTMESNIKSSTNQQIVNLIDSNSPLLNRSLNNTSTRLNQDLMINLSNQTQQLIHQSVLFVNVKELNLKLYHEIIVSWNILEETNTSDWIGVYKINAQNQNDFIDIRRLNGSKIGHLTWSLDKIKSVIESTPHLFVNQAPSSQNDCILNGENSDQLEFRYYSGSRHTLLARSISLKLVLDHSSLSLCASKIKNKSAYLQKSFSFTTENSSIPNQTPSSTSSDEFLTFRIYDVKAAQLRKGMFFNPDPYVKIVVVPSSARSSSLVPSSSSSEITSLNSFNSNANTYGYVREYKTTAAVNTCFPNWKSDSFVIVSRENDRILFEVKDKFVRTRPSINRFLGRVIIDVNSLIEKAKSNKGKCHSTHNLTKRFNSDNVTGSLTFAFCILTGANKYQHQSKKESQIVIVSDKQNGQSGVEHTSAKSVANNRQEDSTKTLPNGSNMTSNCHNLNGIMSSSNHRSLPDFNSNQAASNSSNEILNQLNECNLEQNMNEANKLVTVAPNAPISSTSSSTSSSDETNLNDEIELSDNKKSRNNGLISTNLHASSSTSSSSSSTHSAASCECDENSATQQANTNSYPIVLSSSSSSASTSSNCSIANSIELVNEQSASHSLSTPNEFDSIVQNEQSSTTITNTTIENQLESVALDVNVHSDLNQTNEETRIDNSSNLSPSSVIAKQREGKLRELFDRKHSLAVSKHDVKDLQTSSLDRNRRCLNLNRTYEQHQTTPNGKLINELIKNFNQDNTKSTNLSTSNSCFNILLPNIPSINQTVSNCNNNNNNNSANENELNNLNASQNHLEDDSSCSKVQQNNRESFNSEISKIFDALKEKRNKNHTNNQLISSNEQINAKHENKKEFENVENQHMKLHFKDDNEEVSTQSTTQSTTTATSSCSKSSPLTETSMIENLLHSTSNEHHAVLSNNSNSEVATRQTSETSESTQSAQTHQQISQPNEHINKTFVNDNNDCSCENDENESKTCVKPACFNDEKSVRSLSDVKNESSMNNSTQNEYSSLDDVLEQVQSLSIQTDANLSNNHGDLTSAAKNDPSNNTPANQDVLPSSSTGSVGESTHQKDVKAKRKEQHSTNKSSHATTIYDNTLPPYWESRVDHLGRVFYIDHLNRTTTWIRPSINLNQSSQELANQRMLNSEMEKQRLDKRYQSIRRTINQNNKNDPDVIFSNKSKHFPQQQQALAGNAGQPANDADAAHSSTLSSTEASQPDTLQTSEEAFALRQPGALFILRPDLEQVIKKHDEAKAFVKQTTNLLSILQKIRANPIAGFKKYQHNKDLVKFLNFFSDPSKPMPFGWEMKYHKNDRVFFVDHNTRSTTFIDPRLPLVPLVPNSIPESQPNASSSISTPPHITTITTLTTPSSSSDSKAMRNSPSLSNGSFENSPETSIAYESPSTNSSQAQKTKTVFHPRPPPPPPQTTPSSDLIPPPAQPPPPPPRTPPSLLIQQTASQTNNSNAASMITNIANVSTSATTTQQSRSNSMRILASSTAGAMSSSESSSSPSNNNNNNNNNKRSTTSASHITGPSESASRMSSTPPQQQPQQATSVATSSISYSERVVAYLQQANVFDLIKSQNIQLSSKQKDKLNHVRQGGKSAYNRMCADIDFASVISQLEEEIMCFVPPSQLATTVNNQPSNSSNETNIVGALVAASGAIASSMVTTQPTPNHVNSSANASGSQSANSKSKGNRREYHRGFQSKLRNFYRKLESKGYGQGPQKSKIVIRRDKLMDDARIKFMQLSKHELRRNKLFICFHAEEGLDYGGPAREFFYLLSRELFNPYYGLFEYSASDMYTVQISPMSAFQEHALEWFKFAGRILGVALIHQYLLDAFFTRPFYKALLKDTNWTLSDLETLDPGFCQSLVWMKENDITDCLDLTFSVTEDKCGQIIERDLKENGRNIPVTEKNKFEYIQRVIKWRVERGVQQQTEALVKGFYEVVDPKHVQIFDARELELVLCGTIEIDVSDWKKHTDYRSGYHSTHPIIVWFWQAVDRFDNDQKLKLLQFVTGTSSIPYEGFAALRGSNGPRKFCIERWGTVDALPRAHTCFNRLDLPPYTSFEVLYDKLILAIEETSGFCIQ